MNDCDLGIYYDNPNEASDMYLKWLLKDCEENGISYEVCHNAVEWLTSTSKSELYLEPILDSWINSIKCNEHNVDSPSATAQGIYDYITEHYPDRAEIIAVIGRGLVGSQLIEQLIQYGYTVFEFNSKSDFHIMYKICASVADIVVGLATQEIFNEFECKYMDSVLIDSGNNFNTKNKLRCGKWTRQVIIDRIKRLKEGAEI